LKVAYFTHLAIVWCPCSGEPVRISGWNLSGKN